MIKSCKPPAGQTQLQKALPKNNEETNNIAKNKKLPEMIPFTVASIIR